MLFVNIPVYCINLLAVKKLGANGAALVLAAMCRSPRRELRRLSAKALAALTWNCQVDSRALGADVREQWRLWVDVAVSREMTRNLVAKVRMCDV